MKYDDLVFKFIEVPFFLYISSRSNIEKLKFGVNFNIDFTYKIVGLDFPLLILGFTDLNRVFHLSCLCLARYENEKTVEPCLSTTAELCKESGFELNIETLTSDYGKQFPGPFLRFNPNVVFL